MSLDSSALELQICVMNNLEQLDMLDVTMPSTDALRLFGMSIAAQFGYLAVVVYMPCLWANLHPSVVIITYKLSPTKRNFNAGSHNKKRIRL